ncbi:MULTISPECIES: CAP-associated domain-containing protein [unclassified Paenibacillus]|uniref:CAP-associated domain-containing protein n=1 Tax=unclassified Paenibacillus TaxID=185978 RepID=UPI001AE756A0|nr:MULTISPECIES: CAP-associated domain-containing protein [unclassified Paenibacillus]MBP1156909.1 uncharacterized protein YkwD [Paenibacillus sp. PvP091]MBP1172352.1 uncharacterized protein YkwD [Paenibacillus sp. PvR098]MBP2438733.1 uncharacterized protein YkwD [Paenibacillus sp. PvP052]
MNKRWLSYVLSVTLGVTTLLSVVPSSTAAGLSGFKDTSRHWSSKAVTWAADNGIVNGYEDGTFRPDQVVSEPEFLAMLLRAYPETAVSTAGPGAAWYEPYYNYAWGQQWPVLNNANRSLYNRGYVARLIAATQNGTMGLNDSIRYLLDQGLSQGKTAATIEGYKAVDKLTRAEAVQFILNMKQNSFRLHAAPAQSKPSIPAAANAAISVKGIAIGDTVDSVTEKLGAPARKDASEYGFHWYIYNQDYNDYAQIGISGNKVVALYSPSANWRTDRGIADGSGKAEVDKQYGTPVSFILKGNTRFMTNYGKGEHGTYEISDAYVTFFYDLHRSNVVTGVQVIGKSTEISLEAFYPKASDALARAYERQSIDLANAGRAKLGLAPFAWDDAIASTARKHSQDMAAKGYFDHSNLSGLSPFDRMEQDGLRFRAAAENIAAGQTSAIFAHHGWMNSEGHRKNLLGSFKRLGVGVHFGGKLNIYYTQNFYTP